MAPKKEYLTRNSQWLEEKSREEGVLPLPCGLYYRILAEGPAGGKSPDRNSVVTVHYTGKTINGKTFDSSRSGVAPAFRLRDLITGWNIALQRMRPGDRWEVYIPAEHAYGNRSQPGIPGGSTLIFDIELIAVN